MPIKKSELYSSLWASCDELRGGMDASQYKDYVLVLLFVKYVSDKAASQKNYLLDVPRGGSFADMVALKGDKEIGDKMNKIISKLAEATIRREIVKRGYIKGIIGLPPNLTFNRQLEIPGYSRMVSLSEISDPKNDYNLNLPRYIDSTEPEDLQDIDGHLRGGIPDRDLDALADYWQVFPTLRSLLFELAGRSDYSRLKLPVTDIKTNILGHEEFSALNASINALFEKWKHVHISLFKSIAIGDKPKALIETLSEDLLETFRKARLFDAYDIYQHLMDYWTETMQDDVYMLVSDGWGEAAKPRLIIEDKDKKTKEKPDFAVGKQKFKADLISASLLIAKKRDLKKAAMQQLLTGQTRLPGFSGEWESASFGSVLHKVNAKEYQIKTTEYQTTGILPIVDQGKDPVVGFSDRENKRFRCPEDGVIVFGDHTCFVKFVDFDFVVGADGTQILAAKAGHNARFHAFDLQHRGIASTGYNRHFKFLKERPFVTPPLEEQNSIAAVLSDMDAEIEALEQRLTKTRALKQGMMQELLTGRVRLV